jgi:hypothetical protein
MAVGGKRRFWNLPFQSWGFAVQESVGLDKPSGIKSENKWQHAI